MIEDNLKSPASTLVQSLLIEEALRLREWKKEMSRLMNYYEHNKGFSNEVWKYIKKHIEE